MEQYPITSSLITYWSMAVDVANAALMADEGINLSQYRALKLVADRVSKATMPDIASELALSRSQAGKLAKQLVKLGAIRKSSDYAANLRITSRGMETLSKSSSSAARAMMNLMLPAKPAFDRITLLSRSWITAGLGASTISNDAFLDQGVDIGSAIRLGLEGAAKMERDLAKLCRKEGLTKLEFRILLAIRESNGDMRATDLADALIAKPSNVSIAIKNLIAHELIGYAPEQNMPRSALLRMTQPGSLVCEKVTEALNEQVMALGGADSPEMRNAYIEISRICVNAERDRRRARLSRETAL